MRLQALDRQRGPDEPGAAATQTSAGSEASDNQAERAEPGEREAATSPSVQEGEGNSLSKLWS